MNLTVPAPLNAEHDVSKFTCQHQALTDWLIERALKNSEQRASQTYVVCDENRVVGYYSLSAGSLQHRIVTSAIRRNMPDPIPAVILGRLAVDSEYQGKGIGAGLLKSAIVRSLVSAQTIAARALFCHATDDNAKVFYVRHGFVQSPIDDMTVMLDLNKVVALLGNST